LLQLQTTNVCGYNNRLDMDTGRYKEKKDIGFGLPEEVHVSLAQT
jgi:hypothetical protein